MGGRRPFWSSSILVVFHFGRLPFWSSSFLAVFLFGHLPFWLSSILVVFHFGRLPFWSSSILVVFHFGLCCSSVLGSISFKQKLTCVNIHVNIGAGFPFEGRDGPM